MSIAQVIGWKFNNQEGMSTRDGVITKFPGGVPSQADQDLWTAEYNAHVEATAYSSKREEAYALLNQFEMQFNDSINSTTTWVDAINEIKQRFPK
tara:strand:- start:9 stop:293 length:285 start_codon:yes stop_codon:yes gene_type:complete